MLAAGSCEVMKMPTRRKASTTAKPTSPKKTSRKTLEKPVQTVTVEQTVASRAYELFLERGGEHGRDWDDWLCAERELSSAQR